jgi:cytochrome c peroxidase
MNAQCATPPYLDSTNHNTLTYQTLVTDAGRIVKVTGAGYAGVTSYIESVAYWAFSGVKTIGYGNGKALAVTYDSRMRTKRWNTAGVLGWTYYYGYFGENTGRVTYAQSLNSGTLNRSYEYDQVGRLIESQTGSDARYHAGVTTTPGTGDGPYGQTYAYDKWGNMTSRQGRGGADYVPYTGTFTIRNQRQGHTFDAAGNLTTAGAWTYTYDATGQQREARENNVLKLAQGYDGNRMRVKKDEEGVKTYYLRSSVLGGQVIAEIDGTGQMKRGYVYMGGQMLALQDTETGATGGTQQVSWVHQDPVTKSQRFTSSTGAFRRSSSCPRYLFTQKLMMHPPLKVLILLAVCVMTLLQLVHGTVQQDITQKQRSSRPNLPTIPLGLTSLTVPKDNPLTEARVLLGKKLFFDNRLSLHHSRSCATCHLPDHGFAENLNLSISADGRTQRRNAPSVLNVGYLTTFMWDGRFDSLEAQALEPFTSWGDMGIELDEALNRLKAEPEYVKMFQKAFSSAPTDRRLAQALACYLRSLVSGGTRFDQFLSAGREDALSNSEKDGYALFTGRARCAQCHNLALKSGDPLPRVAAIFTDQKFHNLGVGYNRGRMRDVGRYGVTGDPSDWGAFKTPSLRNVALTAPYMHDGSLAALEDVVEFYDQGGKPNPNLSPTIKPLNLTAGQKAALVAFLNALTDPELERAEVGK